MTNTPKDYGGSAGYTAPEDARDMTLESNLIEEVEVTTDAEAVMRAERARYAQVLADLDELEIALTAQEAQAALELERAGEEASEEGEAYPLL